MGAHIRHCVRPSHLRRQRRRRRHIDAVRSQVIRHAAHSNIPTPSASNCACTCIVYISNVRMGAHVEGTCRAHSRRVIIVFAECADLCGSDIHRTALQLCCCWWRPTHPRTHICAMCTHELVAVAVVCVCKVPVFACFGPCALLFLRCAAAHNNNKSTHTDTHSA